MALSPIQEIPAQTAIEPTEAVPNGRIVMTKIFVTGLKLDAEIGVYAHEKGRAQPLVVDVELDVPSAGTRKLADTINYAIVGERARAIASEGHIHLVEDFAERLARAMLADDRVMRARVRVEKPLALAPHAAAAGVEITVVRG